MSGYLAEFIRWFTCWYLGEFIRWLIYLGTCWYLAEFIRWLVHLGTCWGQTMSKASKQQKVQQTKEHTTNKRCPQKSQTLKAPIKKNISQNEYCQYLSSAKVVSGPSGTYSRFNRHCNQFNIAWTLYTRRKCNTFVDQLLPYQWG